MWVTSPETRGRSSTSRKARTSLTISVESSVAPAATVNTVTSGGRAGGAGGALLQAESVASNAQPSAIRGLMGGDLVEFNDAKCVS